ncbi:hypothetical protein GCM10011339_28340 [Echinicola rosea]|uniref:Uncharacterized protein n=1 Tax=Echinicola rosea TaxID=1807691 RepID=A0ABQ1V437_9BACT|nr:hypothetical protein GCM10011339_28340 [Echinicola rosea]
MDWNSRCQKTYVQLIYPKYETKFNPENNYGLKICRLLFYDPDLDHELLTGKQFIRPGKGYR